MTGDSLNASLCGTESYSTTSLLVKSGEKSLKMDGKSYAMIPYTALQTDEITIATWVRWSTASNWQRVFDFGNGTNEYMFFTPSNGSEMRFVMKNGGDEQILTNGRKLSTSAWHHIAITLKPTGEKVQAVLYLDGQNIAESSEFTIRPSDIAPSLCYIGRSMFVADPFFSGNIDDFRIYNYALTADQVAGIMTDTEAKSKDINDNCEVATAIEALKDNSLQQAGNKVRYDLSGKPVQEEAKGILIQNGKKIYVK